MGVSMIMGRKMKPIVMSVRRVTLALLALSVSACGTSPEKSLRAKYEAMTFPVEANDFDALGEPDLKAMAADPLYADMAVYRVKVLPSLSTHQRAYRLHLFLPSGPALWVARERKAFGKKIKEETRTLTAAETQSLLDVIKSAGLIDANGRCAVENALTRTEGDRVLSTVTVDGTDLEFEMMIRGQNRHSQCTMGYGSGVEQVAKAFAAMNGDELASD